MGTLIKSLTIVLLAGFALVSVTPPAIAGSMQIYNHDCGAKRNRDGTKVHIRATNQAGIPENRTCTEKSVSVGANSYVTVDLAVNNHEGEVCDYLHLADGMVGGSNADDVKGNEDARITCRKQGFLKMCHCNKN